MKHAFLKNTLALATAAMLSASAASAATFALDTTDGTATTLPAATYDLAAPILPHDIISFQDNGLGGLFGGLEVIGADANTILTYTYLGSEAGATNSAFLDFGPNSFSNDGSTAVGASFMVDALSHLSSGFVDLVFGTDNLGGFDTISNTTGGASDPALRMAFTDITNATGDVTSIFAFFGDGLGDSDYDDMAICIDVSQVPLPAGGLLLISAFGGLAAMRKSRNKA